MKARMLGSEKRIIGSNLVGSKSASEAQKVPMRVGEAKLVDLDKNHGTSAFFIALATQESCRYFWGKEGLATHPYSAALLVQGRR